MLKLLIAAFIAVSAMKVPEYDPDRIPPEFEQNAMGQQIKLDIICKTPEGLVELARKTNNGPIQRPELPDGCLVIDGEIIGTIKAIRQSGIKTSTTEAYYVLVELPNKMMFGTVIREDTTRRPIA